MRWTVLTFSVDVALAEEAADWVREELGVEPVVLERPHARVAWVEVYYEGRGEAERARVRAREAFPAGGSALRGCDECDWQLFWRSHFRRCAVGRRLQIVPVWEEAVEDGRLVLWLDPGLSFGTGDHFTTRFCLEQIEWLFERGVPSSFLDAGTGSGILAVAAHRLGCGRVEAFDHDPLCLVYARNNLVLNGAEGVRLFEHDVRCGMPEGVFEVVCANMYAGLLVACAGQIAGACGEWLVVTGILPEESDGVSEAFRGLGGQEVVWDGDGAWCGMVFRFPKGG